MLPKGPKADMADPKGQKKGRVAQGDGEHMDGQPEVAAKHRLDGLDGRVEDRSGHYPPRRSRPLPEGSRRGEETVFEDELKDEGEDRHAEGHPDKGLVHIGDRRPARDEAAQRKAVNAHPDPRDENEKTRLETTSGYSDKKERPITTRSAAKWRSRPSEKASRR